MAYGEIDYGCRKGCTALFADSRERSWHEDEREGPVDMLNDFLNEVATESVTLRYRCKFCRDEYVSERHRSRHERDCPRRPSTEELPDDLDPWARTTREVL